MAKKLIVIFFFTGNIIFAQNKPEPTQFDKFVNKPKIVWAAYASDTINFANAGLNIMLLNRLGKKEIKASLPIESRTSGSNQIRYITLDQIDNTFYGDNEDLVMDSSGNVVIQKRAIPKKDSSNFKLTEVTQILYTEKGILKSYVPFVTPTLPVFMSTGTYVGERFYFTTCFNKRYNYKSRKKNKVIFLSQTKKMIKLKPAEPSDNLKEMYGQNLLETLWPNVLKNEIAAFSIDNNRKLKPEELDISLTYEMPVLAPIYDSTSVSTVVAYKVVADAINPKRFTDVELVQDWYYDHKKNKVFSNIKEMVLYLSKFDKKEDKIPVPVLKLVFK
jgi:Gliding motility associated protein GldN